MLIQIPMSWITAIVLSLLAASSAANPLPNNEHITIPPSTTSPALASNGLSQLAASTPTCFPVSSPLTPVFHSPQPLTSFSSDCIATMKSFLTWPTVSITRYHWRRMSHHSITPAGYAPLPFVVSKYSCVLVLDVLEDSTAEDEFSLVSLKESVLRLFERCVRGAGREGASGFVAVGPKKVMGLTIKPKPHLSVDSEEIGKGNETGWMDVQK